MDMKRILQAMDGVATKPVVGANDMARFLRVVSEADLNQMPDPRQDTQADGTPTYTADELADIQHPNAAEWVAVRNQIQDAKVKGVDPAEIAKLQARYNQLAGGNAERWEQTYAKNQAVKAADQAAGYNNNVRYVTPATTVQENDLSKFLSIVDKNNVNLLMEGSPHKVSLPVQMAMQHYQKENECQQEPQVARVGRESVVRKYFDEAEDAYQEEQTKKKNFYKQYAQTIAERVLMKESAGQRAAIAIAKKKSGKYNKDGKRVKENEVPGHSAGFTGGAGPGMGNYVVDEAPLDFDKENPSASTIHSHKGVNPASIEARIMRARGQLKELAEMASSNELVVWESIARHFPELAMNIEQIRHGIEELAAIRKGGGRRVHNIPKHIGETNNIKETNAKKRSLKNSNPCWDGYKPVGTKKKGGRTVPNCVPKE
jgi:hypothetical protein